MAPNKQHPKDRLGPLQMIFVEPPAGPLDPELDPDLEKALARYIEVFQALPVDRQREILSIAETLSYTLLGLEQGHKPALHGVFLALSAIYGFCRRVPSRRKRTRRRARPTWR